MFATGETVGLAEWVIDDTCLVLFMSIALSTTCKFYCPKFRDLSHEFLSDPHKSGHCACNGWKITYYTNAKITIEHVL